MSWEDALRTKTAGRSFQPQGQGGAQRAGAAGYGAGNVPYAPGAQQFNPSNEPPRGSAPAPAQLPSGAGNGAPMAPSTPAAVPSPGGPPSASQGQAPVDPMAMMRYANYLYRRFAQARQQGGQQSYRG